MNKKPSLPEFRPESLPELPAAELLPVPQSAPESEPSGAEKQAEKRPEQTVMDDAVVITNPTATPAPVAPTTIQPFTDDGNPNEAKDLDVIERTWIKRAKKIIDDTKDDPFAQENAVERLQIDYLKKRYGRDVRASR